MGLYFTDKFSLLHFAAGIVAYYWGISFSTWFIVHALFELLENTQTGMHLIRTIKIWPGGKSHADSIINSVGDQFYSCAGWLVAEYYCKLMT